MQYLLCTYATAEAMSEVLKDLRNIHQGETKVEEEYRKRLNEEVFRCVNVHSQDEKFTLSIIRLSDTIRTVVARYRECIHLPQLIFESLTNFSKLEDEAYRARSRHLMDDRILAATASTG